jgi:hypothetical protein
MSATVQTVLFPRDRWTIERAAAWLIDNDFVAPKVHTTPQFFRFRQRHPRAFVADTFRTLSISAAEGIEVVVGVLKSDRKKVAR